MQTRSSDENSVCLSVKRVLCDKTEKRSVQIFISYKRSFSLVFWEEEWLVRGDPFYVKVLVNRPPFEGNSDFQPIFARISLAVTPTEKSPINTNRKWTTRFPMSLRWSSYVVPKPPKGGLKNAKQPISRNKSHFAWRKSATKFLCVKTLSGKVVRHSLA